MSSSTAIAPVSAPRVLDASVDEYIDRVLSRIPANKTGSIELDASNAGALLSAGARRGRLSGVGFVGWQPGNGATVGARGRFVF